MHDQLVLDLYTFVRDIKIITYKGTFFKTTQGFSSHIYQKILPKIKIHTCVLEMSRVQPNPTRGFGRVRHPKLPTRVSHLKLPSRFGHPKLPSRVRVEQV